MPLTAWRLTTPPYADLTGEGARRAGGRWSPRGAAVVYAGDHPALAVAEYLVHVRDPEDLPDRLVFLRIVVPDGVAVAAVSLAEVERADPEWRRAGSAACLALGAAWLEARGAAAAGPRTAVDGRRGPCSAERSTRQRADAAHQASLRPRQLLGPRAPPPRTTR